MVIYFDERKALPVVIDLLRWRLIHSTTIFLQTSSGHINFHFFCLGQKVIERSVTDSKHNWKTLGKLPSQ